MYVAAFAPDAGQSSAQQGEGFPVGPGLARLQERDGYLTLPADAIAQDFAPDVMKKSATLLYSTQVPLKASALGDVVSVAAWRSKPSWYVLSRDDRMLSPQLQAATARRIGAQLQSIGSSHVSLLSHPAQVADSILEAAGVKPAELPLAEQGLSDDRAACVRAAVADGTAGWGCAVDGLAQPGADAQPAQAVPAAGFDGGGPWHNSPPLTLEQLRGQVVLVEFWTYTCSNCLNVAPYVHQWHARYAPQGLRVIGVHTPEFAYEGLPGNVRRAITRLDITWPVVQDNQYRIWNTWGNRFWPALYLLDRQGRVVYRHYGEGDYARTETEIQRLLASP